MGLDPAWVDEQVAWLKAPRLSTKELVARGRDRIRDQLAAAERERNAPIERNQTDSASPVMGLPHVAPSTLHQQNPSVHGAQKRKEPDWNLAANAYANGHPAQRPRVPAPRANPWSPYMTTPNPAQASYVPASSAINMGVSTTSLWNSAYAIGQNQAYTHGAPAVPNGNHGILSPDERVPVHQHIQQLPPTQTTVPASAPASASAVATPPRSNQNMRESQSQSHMAPPARNVSSTAPSSTVIIKQEAVASCPAQRSSTESNIHNSRSTTVEARSPTGPISGTSSPRRNSSLDVNTAQPQGRSSYHEPSNANRSRSPVEAQRATPSMPVDASPSIHNAEASALSPAIGETATIRRCPAIGGSGPQSPSSPTSGCATLPSTANVGESQGIDSNKTPEDQSHGSNASSSGRQQSADAERVKTVQSAVIMDAAEPLASATVSHPLNASQSSIVRSCESTDIHESHPWGAAAAPSPGTGSGTARVSPRSPLMVPMVPTPADDAMPVDEPSSQGQSDDHIEASSGTALPELDVSHSTPPTQNTETTSRASSSSIPSLVESSSESSSRGAPRIEGSIHQKRRRLVSFTTSRSNDDTCAAPVTLKKSTQISTGSSAASANPRDMPASSVAGVSPSNTGTKEINAETERKGSPIDSSDSASRRSSNGAHPTEPASNKAPHESRPARQPSYNVWSDRRCPSARHVSPAEMTSDVAPVNKEKEIPSKSANYMPAHVRHRLETKWPESNLSKYEALNQKQMDIIAYLAGKRIPERVVQANINMEALNRMERKTKNFQTNVSGDPYPTEFDCIQTKENYLTWQDKHPGAAPRHFPSPERDHFEHLVRKFAVQVSSDGFLAYQTELARRSTDEGRSTQTERAERTESASLLPKRKLTWPAWYEKIKPQQWQSRAKSGGFAGVDAKLGKIKQLMRGCAEKKTNAFDDIRRELHQLPFLEVTAVAVRKAQMLHVETGLPQLFESEYSKGVDYPWDIQADAFELYNRWCLRIFSTDLLRGIVKSQKAHNRSTDRIEPGFPGKSGAAYYGQGDLVNGQWWPTQLCTVRDGAHGSTQGGIYSVKDKAAFSIIVSGGSQYNDRDEGQELWYSGTNSTDGKYTENTQSLILSVEDKKPVRVIRSHNIHKKSSKFRPARGFRYDGLYDVVDFKVVDESKKACLFHMVRRPGQDPIRAEGKSMRPTQEEIAEYDKIKKMLNEVGSDA
ncbi:hypothetical protein IWX49DRAFT_203079 [Phyllosticta citricarpa]|uniref:YDG domain-containing protein n=1 Tax=Phyllosticta citricarpa TaxID=55181 RepID=A0ABR1M1D9_9PEZI